MPSKIRRYLLMAVALLIAATLFSLWRESCTPSCQMRQVVLGYPVFLRTPYEPYSPGGPEFMIIPFFINILWTIAVSISFWAVVDTAQRWRERGQQPPFV